MRAISLTVAIGCGAAVLGVSATRAPAADQDTAASSFAVRTVRLLVENRYAAAWNRLHPSHQRATGGRERYVECELRAPFVDPPLSVEGLAVWDERVAVAGVGHVRTKAVSIQVAFASGEETTHTVHIVRVGARWRWVLPAARYASYMRGRC